MADNTTITAGSGTTIATDDVGGVHYQKMKMIDPTADSSTGIGIAANPLRVDPTGSTAQPISGTVTGITNTISVQAADGTLAVYFSPSNPKVTLGTDRIDAQRVFNLIDGTISTVTRTDRVMNLVDGTISAGTLDYVTRVRNLLDGTLTTVTGLDRVRNVIDGTLTTLTGVDRVRHIVDGTVTITGSNTTLAVYFDRGDPGVKITSGTVTNVSNTVAVYFDRGDPGVKLTSGTVTNVTNTVAVYFDRGDPGVNVSKFNGGAAVTPNTGIPAVNVYATTSIFTVSGSTSGISVSGVNLVAPSANYNFKVFAYSVQTTALVSLNVRFVNGSGASQTEFWRPLVTPASSSSLPVGAVMAVQPPGFIFATGTNTSLNILLDSASLVHYSVSYIKESA